jgi:hypothetical protein
MGLLDGLIDFRVEVDLALSPVLNLTDDSLPGVPAGWSGDFTVVGPTGLIYDGTLDTPNVADGVSDSFTVPLVPGENGYPAPGQYSISYHLAAPGEDSAVKTKVFNLAHTPIVPVITQLLDVYTPNVRLTDDTDVAVAGYTVTSEDKIWVAELPTVGSSNSTVDFILLQVAGVYYSGAWLVGYDNMVEYVSDANPWLTVRAYYDWDETVNISERNSFAELLDFLDQLKAVASAPNCGSAATDYIYAASLLSHISMLVRNDNYADVPALLSAYISILQRYDIIPGSTIVVAPITGGWSVGDDDEAIGGTVSITTDENGSDFGVTPSPGNNFILNLPIAAAGKTGKLSNTDWLAFNSKVSDGANIGTTGENVFAGKSGTTLQFRKLKAVSNISITTVGDEIHFSASTAGEVNTGGNLGSGAEVYKVKDGPTLQFRTLTVSNGLGITPSSNEINIAGPILTQLAGTTGLDVYAGFSDGQHKFRKLRAGSNVGIALVGDELVISATGIGGGGGSTTLDGLLDVVITDPVEGQVLTWNGTAWVNADAPSTPEQIVAYTGTMY